MGYSIAYNSGTTTPFGTFKQGPITMALKPDEYTVSSGFTWYANAEYLNDAYLIISDTYSQGWSTQSEAKPTIWRSATGTTESFVSLVNQLPDVNGVTGFTDSGSAMGYLQSTGKYFVSKDEYLGIVTDGLVLNLDAGWYPSYSGAGTTWKDLAGSNNGTLTNGPTFSGSSIVFDGVDDYVTINNSLIFLNDDPFTSNTWIKPITGIESRTYAVIFTLKATSTHWQVSYSSDVTYNLLFSFAGTSTSVGTINSSTSLIPLNTWGLVSVQYNGGDKGVLSSWKIYINGVEVSIRLTGFTGASSNTNSLGFRPGSGGASSNYFLGDISIHQIYNRALTASEVLQNYNATKGRFGL